MNNVAIIPARGGSVRVPRKNVKLLHGKPLIYYTIKSALDSNIFKGIFVSTEDEEIAYISSTVGAKVINRPVELAEDVESELVIKHAIEEIEKEYPVDTVTMLQPTSPFRSANTIKKCVNELIKNWDDFESVITVNDIEGDRPEWMCYIDHHNDVIPYTNTWKDSAGSSYIKLVARQELPKLYKQNGCIYTFKKSLIMDFGMIISPFCKAIIIDEEEAFDIDTNLDFMIAEKIMERRAWNNTLI